MIFSEVIFYFTKRTTFILIIAARAGLWELYFDVWENMMFKPTYVFDKAGSITPEFLHKKKIKGLILDLDNTLTTHNNPVPPQSSLDWLDCMRAAGIKLMIVSNNHAPRVKPFAEKLGVDFVSEGKKPLTFGYTKAIRKMGLKKENVATVGDQIFTDIMGANLKGIRSFFVFPIEPETGFWFRVKRKIEKAFLPKSFTKL